MVYIPRREGRAIRPFFNDREGRGVTFDYLSVCFI